MFNNHTIINHTHTNKPYYTLRTQLEKTFQANKHKYHIARLLHTSSQKLTYLTYYQTSNRIRILAFLLHCLGKTIEHNTLSSEDPYNIHQRRRPFVGIAGPNTLEWLITDFACSGTFLPTVGLHPNWDSQKLQTVLTLTNMKILITTNYNTALTIYNVLRDINNAPSSLNTTISLQYILVLDPQYEYSYKETTQQFLQLQQQFHTELNISCWTIPLSSCEADNNFNTANNIPISSSLPEDQDTITIPSYLSLTKNIITFYRNNRIRS